MAAPGTHRRGRPGTRTLAHADPGELADSAPTHRVRGRAPRHPEFADDTPNHVTPAQSARQMENCLHWVRDVTYLEDKSLVRTGNAPRVMASLRSLAISLLRLDGHDNIAAANRHHLRDPQRTLKLLQAA